MTSLAPAFADKWIAGVSGAWSVAANWSLGRAPKPGNGVDIEAGAPLTVTFDLPDFAFGGLTLVGATLDLEGGGLTATGPATLENAAIVGVKPITLRGASAIGALKLGGAVVLTNRGQATQSGGTLTIGDSKTTTAYIHNAAGATWTIADASGMAQGGQPGWNFVNSGALQMSANAGLSVLKANVLSTGSVSVGQNSTLEFDGRRQNLSGSFAGPGDIAFGPDGLTMLGALDVSPSALLSNQGVVDMVGTMTMHEGATIYNNAGASWNFDGDVSLSLAQGLATAGLSVQSLGVIAKTAGTGVSAFGVNVVAHGAVDVETGTLAFEGAVDAFLGQVEGAGTFEVAGGISEFANGASLSVANLTLSGGEMGLLTSETYAGVFVGDSGATLALVGSAVELTLTGPLTNNSQDTFAGLSIVGSGVLTLKADTVISGASIGGTVEVKDQFVVQQSGALTLGDSSASDAASLTVSGDWVLDGAASILLGADAVSEITIGAGVLTHIGSGVSTVAPSVINNGVNVPAGGSGYQPKGIEAEGGTLEFKGAVAGTGSDNISGGVTPTTLQFDGAVGSGQTVVFFGSGGVLSLKDLPAFNGAITNFDAYDSNDTIQISGGYVFTGATETATSTTLNLLLFGQTPQAATLTLTGDYEGKTFYSQSQSGVLQIS